MGEVEDLLISIKELWPKFPVSKENLQRPTQELVIQLYNNFLKDYDAKVTSVPINYNKDNIADYELEELFQRLSSVLAKINGLKFTLADLYQPAPIRTKNFFKVCTHFIHFTGYIENETEALENSVMKTKEDIGKCLFEQQELIVEMNKSAKIKAELGEDKSLLEELYKTVNTSYKEMKTLKSTKEKLYAEKRKQRENYGRELQNEEFEFVRLENIEKDLLEQMITEREHQNIMNTLEALKRESDILDSNDVDIGDGLVHENKVLEHNSDCIRILNDCVFNVDNVKKLIWKEELKAVSITADKLTATKLTPIKEQKIESEQNLVMLKEQLKNLQSEYKIGKDNYLTSSTQFSQELGILKNHFEQESSNNSKIILDYIEDIKKLEEDMKKMEQTFTDQYIRVSKVEKTVVDTFKDTLIKFKESV